MIIFCNNIYILYDETYDHYILRQLIENHKVLKTFNSNLIMCKTTSSIQKSTYITDLYNLYGNCSALFTDSNNVGYMRQFITNVVSKNCYRLDFYLLLVTYLKRACPYLFIVLVSHACVDCTHQMCYKFVMENKLQIVNSVLHQSIKVFIQGGIDHFKLKPPKYFLKQQTRTVGYDLHEVSQYDYGFLRTHQCEIFDAIRIFVLLFDMERTHIDNIPNPHIDGYIDNLLKFTNHGIYEQHKKLLVYVSELCAYIDNMSNTSIVDLNQPHVSFSTLVTASDMIPTKSLTQTSANRFFFSDEIELEKYEKSPITGQCNPFVEMTRTMVAHVLKHLTQSPKNQLNVLYLNVLKFFIDHMNKYYCAFDIILAKPCLLSVPQLNHIIKTLSKHGYLNMKTKSKNKLTVRYYARTLECRSIKFTKSQLHYLLQTRYKPVEGNLNFSFPHPKFPNTTGDYIV